MSENKCSCCDETLTVEDMVRSFVEHIDRIVDVVIEENTFEFDDEQTKNMFFALSLSHTADTLHARSRALFCSVVDNK